MISTEPDKIIILYLVYGKESLQDGLSILERIAYRMFPHSIIESLVVDNSIQQCHYKVGNTTYISGNNKLREFSGWDHGLLHILNYFEFSDTTQILFSNDTFYQRNYRDGPNFLDVFDRPILQDRDLTNSAIGYLDDFPREVTLNGVNYSCWIRSNIFYLPLKVADKLYPLTAPFSDDMIFSTDPEVFWSDTSLLSHNWKAYISSWLLGAESDQYPEYKLHWINARPATSSNFEYLKVKARCILSEHYLSSRLFEMGLNIIDTNIFEKRRDRHTSNYYA